MSDYDQFLLRSADDYYRAPSSDEYEDRINSLEETIIELELKNQHLSKVSRGRWARIQYLENFIESILPHVQGRIEVERFLQMEGSK